MTSSEETDNQYSVEIPEQELKVAELLNLSAEDVAEIHQGNTTKLSYRQLGLVTTSSASAFFRIRNRPKSAVT